MLLTRLADLLAWPLPKSERFPKLYRFTVTQRMMDGALDCQEAVFAAQNRRGEAHKANLQAADAALNCLRLSIEAGQRIQGFLLAAEEELRLIDAVGVESDERAALEVDRLVRDKGAIADLL